MQECSHGERRYGPAGTVVARASRGRSLRRLRRRLLFPPGALRRGQGARQFTGATLRQWDLSELLDEVALVVSELVTNALRHAVAGVLPGSPPGNGPEPPLVRLHLMYSASRLVCAVRDPSEAGPVAGEAGSCEESGRGLYLVESFTDGWGWHPLAGTLPGKIVWALFRLPRPVD